MGELPQTPSSNPDPLSLQLKLYQAFIFSVPILFTIVLLLLFYLFYLKRRGHPSPSSDAHMNSRSFNRANTVLSLTGTKDLKEILPVVIFDEDSREKDTQCCVCLGDFEIKEHLQQIPSCKHIFHSDCIQYWLMSNTTCPLCRACILPVKNESPMRLNMSQGLNAESGSSAQLGPQGQLLVHAAERMHVEQSSSSEGPAGWPCLMESRNSRVLDAPIDADVHNLHGSSAAVQIQIHEV